MKLTEKIYTKLTESDVSKMCETGYHNRCKDKSCECFCHLKKPNGIHAIEGVIKEWEMMSSDTHGLKRLKDAKAKGATTVLVYFKKGYTQYDAVNNEGAILTSLEMDV